MNGLLFGLAFGGIFGLQILLILRHIWQRHAQVQGLLAEAEDYLQMERPDEAIVLLRKASRLNPNDGVVWMHLGEAYLAHKMVDWARGAYERAVAESPGLPGAHYGLGYVFLHHQKDTEKALACLEQAVRLDPLFAQGHNSRGVALMELGRWDAAGEAFDAALKVNNALPTAWNNLGITRANQARVDEAIAAFQKAIHLAPKDVDHHANLGNAFAMKGRMNDAIESLRRALALDGANGYSHYWLGCAYQRMGKHDEALSEFVRSTELVPGFGLGHYTLARLYESKGQTEIARRHMEIALVNEPRLAQGVN